MRQAGAIRRISVAVLIDGITSIGTNGEPIWEPRPVEEIVALRGLVIAAIGFDEARGDIVTVASLAFQPDATPGELVESGRLLRFFESNAMTLIQIGVLSLVVLVLTLTVVRPILTRSVRSVPNVGAIAGPSPFAVGPAGSGALPQQIQPGMPAPEVGAGHSAPDADALRIAVADQPEQTVSMLRDWLTPVEVTASKVAAA
ncbi:MAG TPA: flagellar M-ring protein FliF C-terminal domain-containing protein [Thermohalobaculum sp.]|nr:flagellar M-ring protein FliF C-terminal domain-containing protein [Thermohalobaculum sp.]